MLLNKTFRIEKTCRICKYNQFKTILNLGFQPLANDLLDHTRRNCEHIQYYPLTFSRCSNCGLLQLRETVSPKVLFAEYLYFSSYAKTLVTSAERLVRKTIQSYKLEKNDLVVEIGSNDGYLLQFYKNAGIPVLGVEPATNVAKDAIKRRGIPTLIRFFDQKTARFIKTSFKAARVIHANNVLAHIDKLHGFVEGIHDLLDKNGVIIAEVLYVKDMIDKNAFDMIYHEHLCYYSLDALCRLFELHKLTVFDVEHIPAHGGSLRIFAGHKGAYRQKNKVKNFLLKEILNGVLEIKYYNIFKKQIDMLKKDIMKYLVNQAIKRKKTVGYGAAAKATVMLNQFKINNDMIAYIVDKNPIKQGKVIPGTNIKIFSPVRIKNENIDTIFITAWNYAEEIIEELANDYQYRGKILIPLPRMRIIEEKAMP